MVTAISTIVQESRWDITQSDVITCKTILYLQWRFREIATSNENHVFLAMTLFDIAKYCLLTNKLPIAPIRRSTPNSNGETNIVHTFTLQWAARCCIGATSERRRIRLRADNKQYCSARSEHQAFATIQYLVRPLYTSHVFGAYSFATKKHHTFSEAFATSRLHGAVVTYKCNCR